MLDVNAHFVKSSLLTKGSNDFTEIDCIFDGNVHPIKENLFSHVYKKFSDCQFKHYDAALFFVNSSVEFEKNFLLIENCDVIIIFVRDNSLMNQYLRSSAEKFEKIDVLKSFSGNWFLCRRRKTPVDFAIYVITHKKLPVELTEKLPTDYKIIQSGRALHEDLGYIGDDTGDNISNLNPYVNDKDILYWIWKNTSHDIVGISHYRRFFTMSDNVNFADKRISLADFSHEEILTKNQALDILKSYDIIANTFCDSLTEFDNIASVSGVETTEIALSVMEKHLSRVHPDYLDSMRYVMDSRLLHKCDIYVMRKYILDAYCKWLFSFFLDATDEIVKITKLEEKTGNAKRLAAYIGERLFTTWITKNRLRIKDMDITFLVDV